MGLKELFCERNDWGELFPIFSSFIISDLLAVNRLKCWISLNRRAGASDQRRTVAILGYENSSNRVRVLCAVNIRLPVNRPRKIHRYPFLLDVGVSPISNLISHRSVEARVVGEAAGDSPFSAAIPRRFHLPRRRSVRALAR